MTTLDATRVAQLLGVAKQEGRPLRICAPMVRYSKLPFRLLIKKYNVDILYTPMILAHEFNRSSIARDSDFTTSSLERETSAGGTQHALIAQFAASHPVEFARAAEMISPWVDGVDLNCGCPQSWAIKEGIGCSLMSDPELVASLVRAAKERLGPEKSVSVKIRVHKDINETHRWVEMVQNSGVDYITVHGRTRTQRSSTPPDYEAIKIIKSMAKVPVFANGDAYSAADVARIADVTGVDGVMAARGMLENPAMFSDHDTTPQDCVRQFLGLAVCCPIPFPLILHHVGDMTLKMRDTTKRDRKALMDCQDLIDLIDFIHERWGRDTSSNATS